MSVRPSRWLSHWAVCAPLLVFSVRGHAKDCSIGKPCGDTCIEATDTCHVDASAVQPYYDSSRDLGPPAAGAYLDAYYAEKERLSTQMATAAPDYSSYWAARAQAASDAVMAHRSAMHDYVDRAVDALNAHDYALAADISGEGAAYRWMPVSDEDDFMGHLICIQSHAIAMLKLGKTDDAMRWYVYAAAFGDGLYPKPENLNSEYRAAVTKFREESEQVVGPSPFGYVPAKRGCKTFVAPDKKSERGWDFGEGDVFSPGFAAGGWVWGWHKLAGKEKVVGEWVSEPCIFRGLAKKPDVVRLVPLARDE